MNVLSFDGTSIASDWVSMPESKRQLIKLWYHLNPDESYLCKMIESYTLSEVEAHILLDIFEVMQYHPEWITEWQTLVKKMNIERDKQFFHTLNSIPVFEDRLPFLSGNTKDERIYILDMVGQWLKSNAEQVRTSQKIKAVYPLLFAYLQSMPTSIDSIYDEYIADYKTHKLANTLPDSEELFFRGIEPDVLPYRYAALNHNITDSTVVLWIDAMGFEYLSLLLYVLGQNPKGKVLSAELTIATLPTETKFNDQWTQMNIPYEKLDKLDILAHKGVADAPDYYTCIEEQFAFFKNLSETVNELFKSYHRVIITGDHGTSRLAARFFHTRDGLQPPKDATVFSHGRYCSVTSVPTTTYDKIKSASDWDGNKYLVFASYDHFKTSGFATSSNDDQALYGEIHGGASPEEMIVPVVVFESNQPLPLTVQWKDNKSEVRLKKRKVKAKLEFSRAIKELKVTLGHIEATCSSEDGKIWSVEFEKIEPGEYNPVIMADGQYITIDSPLKVISALGGGGDL